MNGPVPLTIATDTGSRFCGIATALDGGLYLQATGIPLPFSDENMLPPTQNARMAGIVFYPLRTDTWLLAIYHVLEGTPVFTLLKNELWHFHLDFSAQSNSQELASEPLSAGREIHHADRVSLDDGLLDMTNKSEVKQFQNEDARIELEDLNDEREDVQNDLIDLELENCGLVGSSIEPPDYASTNEYCSTTIKQI